MSKKGIDYSYALDLTKRINELVINKRELLNCFILDDYNYWQAFQMEIFVRAKNFSVEQVKTLESIERESRFNLLTLVSSFIVSLIGFVWAYVTNCKQLVYTVDKRPQGVYSSDFRMEAVYKKIAESGCTFFEIISTPSGRVLWRNMRLRRRLAWYTNAPDLVTCCFGMFPYRKRVRYVSTFLDRNNFSEDEYRFVTALFRMLIFKFLTTPRRVKWLSRVMRYLKTTEIILIDDMWHWFEVLHAAAHTHVHSVGIQHGHFTKYHCGAIKYASNPPGRLIRPDTMVLSSTYWKRELERLGSIYPESSIVIQELRVDGFIKYSYSEAVLHRLPRRVVIPYETDVPKLKLVPYIEILKKARDITLCFKPRPDINLTVQLEEYGLNANEVVIAQSLQDSIQNSCAVVFGVYSSILYEYVLHKVPVIIPLGIMDYGEGMVRQGLVDTVDSAEKMLVELERIYTMNDDQVLEKRKLDIHNIYAN